MVNKPGKPNSKRTPVRLRHKIQKAGAAKQRKQRKEAKKDPTWRSRLKKDPGIPNLYPYKEKILHEIEKKKRLKEEEFTRKQEEARKAKGSINDDVQVAVARDAGGDEALPDMIDDESMGEGDGTDTANPMSALLASARARATEYEDNEPSDDDDGDEEMEIDHAANGVSLGNTNFVTNRGPKTLDASRRAYSNIYRAVLQNADIILYVLDARDPNGTRSREVEREIASSGDGSKRLILILNKIDLLPPAALKDWLRYLRRSFPTLPLRASTAASNANIFDHKALTLKSTSETLLRALKSYAQSHAQSQQLMRNTTVGVIGYPNVGKSSVINALTSRLGSSRHSGSACPVGAEAGVTTALREVKLDNKLKLLDSPGIVFPSVPDSTVQAPNLNKKQLEEAHLVLLSALPPASIDDPIPAIALLLHRLSNSPATLGPLMEQYGITQSMLIAENGDVTTDFLVHVARKRGRLGKGGLPNIKAAAINVLVDWRDGRIRGWVEPPAEPTAQSDDPNGAVGGKHIVKEWSKEFKLEGLWGDDEGADDVAAMQQ